MPLAVGVFALYPVFGEHVMVTVVPLAALFTLALALPPVPAFTVRAWLLSSNSTVSVNVTFRWPPEYVNLDCTRGALKLLLQSILLYMLVLECIHI